MRIKVALALAFLVAIAWGAIGSVSLEGLGIKGPMLAGPCGVKEPMARAEHARRRLRRAARLAVICAFATGCTGVLQNLGAKWATNKISSVFDFDDAQREATRGAVDRAIANELRKHPNAPAVRELLWNAWAEREDWGPGTRSPEARRADGRKTLRFVYELLDAKQIDHMSERLHEMHETVNTLLGTGGG